jgi:hypothetical protein
LVLVIVTLLVLTAIPQMGMNAGGRRGLITSAAVFISTTGSAPHLLKSCLIGQAGFGVVGFDPAGGYVYVGMSTGGISVVKTPCILVKNIPTGPFDESILSWAYDPVSREMVGVDGLSAYVFQGTSLERVVHFDLAACENPYAAAWDPALSAVLVSTTGFNCPFGGAVNLLYLVDVNGTTEARIIYNVLDEGNHPEGILVADGYVFSAGVKIDVFNDRTLKPVGSFPSLLGNSECLNCVSMTWDPLNHTVVVGYPWPAGLYFLNVSSIASHTFSYHILAFSKILPDGVRALAYSPATDDLFIGPWTLSPSGVLHFVQLGKQESVNGLAYDSVSHDMYACGYSLYVIS